MSAAVDRTHRIRTVGFSSTNPDRWHVMRFPSGRSVVYRGMAYVDSFFSHAEAIAYADRKAREEASRD